MVAMMKDVTGGGKSGMSRRTFLGMGAAALGAVALGGGPLRALAQVERGAAGAGSPVGRVERPNILHIMTDDQDYQSWAERYTLVDRRGAALLDDDGNPRQDYAMRFARSFPGGGWTDFTQHTCSSAICAPSRASILTGVPAREHGVMRNGLLGNLDEANTMATWLAAAGYRTHLVGKYSFGTGGRKHPTPPGWTSFQGRGGLSSTVFREGVDLIRRGAADSAPWAMFLWPVDPHRLAKPTSANAKIALRPPTLPANINEADVSDKPSWIRNTKLMPVGKLRAAEKERVRCYQALMGVDQGIEQVINTLRETGQFERTIIIVMADNGDSWGSHRVLFKDMIYDEAVHVPLAIRVPWMSGNREENRVVSSLDLTATIVEATGVEAGRPLMGRSLLPIIEDGAAGWEGAAYVESHGSPGARSKGRPAFKGLRVGGDDWGQYSYAWYPDTGEVELYDRGADPAQLENVAGRVDYAVVREALEVRLAEFLGRPGYGPRAGGGL